MTINPLLDASLAVQIHVVAALAAILVGVWQLLMPKGTGIHVRTGRAWLVLMAIIALSSFFIHSIRLVGPWSPIHLLSVFTLAMLWVGVWRARKGHRKAHAITMSSLFVFALLGAGAFTLLPGRIMHQVLFSG